MIDKQSKMKRKKILIDARSVGGEGQGMLTYIVGLYNAMKKGYSFHYDFYFAGYDFEAMQSHFPWIKKSNFILLSTTSKWSLFTVEFPSIIKKHKIDYAHFQYVTPFLKSCKQIVTTHDVLFLDFPEEFSWFYRFQRKLLFYFSLLRSEIRLTVSDYSRNKIAEHFNLPAASIAITPNAVKDTFLQPFDKSKIRKKLRDKLGIDNYILYVSRVEKRKNHQQLLDAFETLQLSEQGYQLVLVGNDTLGEQDIAQSIQGFTQRYPGKVHWLRNISDDDLMQLYQGAELFVYPSKAEGFGIPPIEAAALGVNTLCANNTAMQDFYFFKENLYEASDVQQFHELLQKNLNQRPATKELQNIARIVKHQYSWQSAAQVLHQELLTA